MRGENATGGWISDAAPRRTAIVLWTIATALCLGASTADADCSVETRQAAGKYFRVIVCDDSEWAIDDAIVMTSESCVELDTEFETACREAVVESFRLRRESLLRRALKEGASITAAAQLYGYTEEEVELWIDQNTSP